MTVIRLDRFKVDPADTEQMLARRNALVAAVRDTVPGLISARLAKLDDETWIDVWRWDSRSSAQAAIKRSRSGAIPEAAAAFSLTKDLTTEFADVVDER